MKRIRRMFFNRLTWLSLLLLLAGVWVRSYFVTDEFYWQRLSHQSPTGTYSQLRLRTGRGGFGIHFFSYSSDYLLYQSDEPSNLFWPVWETAASAPLFDAHGQGVLNRLGFRYLDVPFPTNATEKVLDREWDAPLWSFCILLGIFPTWRYRNLRQRRRDARKGLCTQCGYDLRATPDCCRNAGIFRPRRRRETAASMDIEWDDRAIPAALPRGSGGVGARRIRLQRKLSWTGNPRLERGPRPVPGPYDRSWFKCAIRMEQWLTRVDRIRRISIAPTRGGNGVARSAARFRICQWPGDPRGRFVQSRQCTPWLRLDRCNITPTFSLREPRQNSLRAVQTNAKRPLSQLWLRPPRHPGPLPGMRERSNGETSGLK